MARANELPQVGFDPNISWEIRSSDVHFGNVIIPDYSQGRCLLPLAMSYEIDLYGKNHLQTKSFKKLSEMTVQDEQMARILISSNFTANYFNLIRTDRLIQNNKKLVELQEQIAKMQRIKYEKGLCGEPEVLSEEQTLTSFKEELNNLEAEQEVIKNQLITLIGEKDLKDIQRNNIENIKIFDVPEYLDSSVITKRPDFIKSEIGHRTNIVTSGISSSIAIMACSSSPELFDQIFLINPESVVESSLYPGKNAKLYKFILDTPIIGSLIYNIAFSRSRIEKALAADYFYNPYSMHARYADAFYEAAHLGKSPKSVFASITCNYTRCSIANALKKIDNSICIICGSAHPANKELIREFKNCNPAVEAYIIQKSKLLPHMEKPVDVYNLIKTI